VRLRAARLGSFLAGIIVAPGVQCVASRAILAAVRGDVPHMQQPQHSANLDP